MKNTLPTLIDKNNYTEFKSEYKKENTYEVTSKEVFTYLNSILKLDLTLPNKIFIIHDLDLLQLFNNLHASSRVIVVLNCDLNLILESIVFKKNINKLKSGGVIYVVGGEVEAQVEMVSRLIDIEKYESWSPLVNPNITPEDIFYYKIFYRKLAGILNIMSLSRATKIHTSYLFLRNSMINSVLAYRDNSIVNFRDVQKNKPVLIVAAGPSLNKQIEILKKYHGIFTIIAVDTVWPILKNNGILPDLIFALDSEAISAWAPNEISDKTCFSVDIGCGPNLVWSNNKNHIFSTANIKIMGLIRRLGAHVDIIPTGGSVATSAFELARFMGANPIILIGQDLALTGGKDHADGYLQQYEKDFLEKRIETGFDVEGYYGDMVRTERQLFCYKTWYENKIKDYPDTMVINSTEGGAKIHGTIQIPFKDVCAELEVFQKVKIFDFPKYDLVFNGQHIENLIVNINLLIEKTEKFISIGHEGESLICDNLSKNNSKMLKKIDLINKKIMNFDMDTRTVVDAFSQIKMEKIRFDVTMDIKPKTLDNAIQKYLDIYMGLQESGELALAMLSQVKNFYKRLLERGSYDMDLLSDILNRKYM